MTTHQILLSLAMFFSFVVAMTNAGYAMTVVLNGGKNTTEEGYFCNESDIIKIKSVIGNVDDDDRNLQSMSNKNSQAIVIDDNNPRDLKYSAKCKQYCKGYAPGTCLATGCKGYRRDKMIRKLSEDTNHQRELSSCVQEITSLNTTLSRLSGVSSGCKAYLTKREITCFDEVKYAAVESFTLWNADTDEMIQEYFKNGDVICSNVKVNIEAVANACVEEIEMELKGPIQVEKEYESSGPYTIFGHSGDDLFGRFLPVGKYTLNTEIEDADIPRATLTFTVKKC